MDNGYPKFKFLGLEILLMEQPLARKARLTRLFLIFGLIFFLKKFGKYKMKGCVKHFLADSG